MRAYCVERVNPLNFLSLSSLFAAVFQFVRLIRSTFPGAFRACNLHMKVVVLRFFELARSS